MYIYYNYKLIDTCISLGASSIKIKWHTQSSYACLAIRQFFHFLAFQFLRYFGDFDFCTGYLTFNACEVWFFNDIGDPRAIFFDAFENAVNTVTRATPIRSAMGVNTRRVGWEIALLTAGVDIAHELIAPMIKYNTRVQTVEWPAIYLEEISTISK